MAGLLGSARRITRCVDLNDGNAAPAPSSIQSPKKVCTFLTPSTKAMELAEKHFSLISVTICRRELQEERKYTQNPREFS